MRSEDESSWMLIQDSDEIFSKGILEKARHACDIGDKTGVYRYLVRSKSVELDANYNPIKEQYDDYWKPLIYKWLPELRIVGFKVHEGFNINPRTKFFTKYKTEEERKLEKTYWYSHSKPPGEIWKRAHCRNFVQGGAGNNMGEFNPLWLPFLKLIKSLIPNYKSWWDYDKYLLNGNVDKELKEWLIAYMYEGEKDKPQAWKDYIVNCNIINKHILNSSFLSKLEIKVGFGYSGQSEIKEGYKYYYRFLHPEEEPEELKNLSIP